MFGLGSQGVGLGFGELVPTIDAATIGVKRNVRSIHPSEFLPVISIFRVTLRVAKISAIFENLLPAPGWNLGGCMHPQGDLVSNIETTKVLRVSREEDWWVLAQRAS
jgi:hypothetical protein